MTRRRKKNRQPEPFDLEGSKPMSAGAVDSLASGSARQVGGIGRGDRPIPEGIRDQFRPSGGALQPRPDPRLASGNLTRPCPLSEGPWLGVRQQRHGPGRRHPSPNQNEPLNLRCVEWSDEDQVYIGKCPDLITGIHGDDPVQVYKELGEVVQEVIDYFQQTGRGTSRRTDAAHDGGILDIPSFERSQPPG